MWVFFKPQICDWHVVITALFYVNAASGTTGVNSCFPIVFFFVDAAVYRLNGILADGICSVTVHAGQPFEEVEVRIWSLELKQVATLARLLKHWRSRLKAVAYWIAGNYLSSSFVRSYAMSNTSTRKWNNVKCTWNAMISAGSSL